MHKHYPCVVSIAGSDSSGGAGIQADIKAISATGSYAATIITGLTAQNTLGVQAIEAVSPAFISKQIHSVFSDLHVDAVKIGMLHNLEVVAAVVDGLKQFKPQYVILDPVMVAKDGSSLLNADTIEYLKETLFPFVSLITPNLPEAEKLMGASIRHMADMENVAAQLGKQFKTNVLLKGGHLATTQASDVLYWWQAQRHEWLHAKRIDSQHTHGTGCTLSAAIASYLAQGDTLLAAITKAKNYLSHCILAGRDYALGHGCGPVNHFWEKSS